MTILFEIKEILSIFSHTERKKPDAKAKIKGSKKYSKINGIVEFFSTKYGVIVKVKINGLPYNESECNDGIFGLHIHTGSKCSGTDTDPFADALTHYNPNNCKHPYHAGDLPPLFGNNGYAYMAVLTNRFTINEIIGKTIIIHSQPDDFKTQPGGDSGKKIACGIIKKGAVI